MKPIYVFSDGGCRNKHNKYHEHVTKTDLCAYAYLIEFPRYPGKIMTGTEAFKGYTNNQMELLGIIKGLNALLVNMPPSSIYRVPFLAVLDSKYIVNAVNKKWLLKWKNQGFKGRKNAQYWKMLWVLMRPFNHLSFKWVHGHREKEKDRFHQGNCFVDHLLNKKMDKLHKE